MEGCFQDRHSKRLSFPPKGSTNKLNQVVKEANSNWVARIVLNPSTWTSWEADPVLHNVKVSNRLVHKNLVWNFQKSRADFCYILINKQMLEKVFCSNIAPSLSSGNHLFYKAEYMGQSCPNQVWAITFDWSALATWNKHFGTYEKQPHGEL